MKPDSYMRHEILYLTDIVEAADHIAEFLRGTGAEEFQSSELVRSAVVHKLSITGEARARISEDLTRRSRNQTGPKIEKLEPPVKCLQRSVAIGRGAWREENPAKNCKDLEGSVDLRLRRTRRHLFSLNFKFGTNRWQATRCWKGLKG